MIFTLALVFLLGGCGTTVKKSLESTEPVQASPRLLLRNDRIVHGDKLEALFYKNYKSSKDEYRFDIGDRLFITARAFVEGDDAVQSGKPENISKGDILLINYYKRHLEDDENYKLDAGDKLSVVVHSYPEYSKDVVILPDGKISLMKVGGIKAKGMTVAQLNSLLTQKYAKELLSPDIDVFVMEAQNKLNSLLESLFENTRKSDGRLIVGMDGTVDLPLIGAISVAGSSLSDARLAVNEKYRQKHCDVEVTINAMKIKKDRKKVTMPEYPEQFRDVVVLPDGTISVSGAGVVKAKGLTIAQLTNVLVEKYKRKYINPEVDVVVVEAQSKLDDFLDLLSQNYYMQSKTFWVGENGTANLPLMKEIHVEGMTLAEASSYVTKKYQEKFPNLEVVLSLNQSVRMTVAIMGEVSKPGVYQLMGNVSPYYALALAGGELNTADMSKLLIIRETNGKLEKIFVNLKSDEGRISKELYVQAGDIVYVLKTGIANVDLFVDQYIRKLMPFDMGAGVFYNINE